MQVFVTGANGFLGSHLVPALLERGHSVTALVRSGSRRDFPTACRIVEGDALDGASYGGAISPADTFVHLIGVAHPRPSRAGDFRSIDLKSVDEAVPAARAAGVSHFIYLSVPQPLPVMRAYAAVRAEGEAIVRASGMKSTFVRPFYVLGPGRWWPYPLLPLFWLLRVVAPETGRRLFPVSIKQMVRALVFAVENPPERARILEGSGIAEIEA